MASNSRYTSQANKNRNSTGKTKCRFLELLTMGLNSGQYKFNIKLGDFSLGAFGDVVLKLEEQDVFFKLDPSLDDFRYNLERTIDHQFPLYFSSFCDIRKHYMRLGDEELMKFDEKVIFNLVSISDFNYYDDLDSSDQSLAYFDRERKEVVKLRDISNQHFLNSLSFTKGRHLQFESPPKGLMDEIFSYTYNGKYEIEMLKAHSKTVGEMIELFISKFVVSVNQFEEFEMQEKVVEMQQQKLGDLYSPMFNSLFHGKMLECVIDTSQWRDDIYIDDLICELQNDISKSFSTKNSQEILKLAEMQSQAQVKGLELGRIHVKFEKKIKKAFKDIKKAIKRLEMLEIRKDRLQRKNKFELNSKFEQLMIEKLSIDHELGETRRQLNVIMNERDILLQDREQSAMIIAQLNVRLDACQRHIMRLERMNEALFDEINMLRDNQQQNENMNYFPDQE